MRETPKPPTYKAGQVRFDHLVAHYYSKGDSFLEATRKALADLSEDKDLMAELEELKNGE